MVKNLMGQVPEIAGNQITMRLFSHADFIRHNIETRKDRSGEFFSANIIVNYRKVKQNLIFDGIVILIFCYGIFPQLKWLPGRKIDGTDWRSVSKSTE